jgi:hypothetical protein
MRKWWWWWLPGWRKKWRLEKRRVEALSDINAERLNVELMAQRPRNADDALNTALLEELLKRIEKIKERAKDADQISDLDDLVEDAELHGQFRGYLCPLSELHEEADLVLDVMEEWGVPKSKIIILQDLLGQEIKEAKTNSEAARSALRALFKEKDSWEDYTTDYEGTMTTYTQRLLIVTLIMPPLAILAFYFSSYFQPLLLFGLLCAGVAGSCTSVMARMPALDISLSSELEAYARRVLNRIGIGVVASFIGCTFLGLLPVSIQNLTFGDALNACATSRADCQGIKSLLLLGLPTLFAFSEYTLTTFEQRVFGSARRSGYREARRQEAAK